MEVSKAEICFHKKTVEIDILCPVLPYNGTLFQDFSLRVKNVKCVFNCCATGQIMVGTVLTIIYVQPNTVFMLTFKGHELIAQFLVSTLKPRSIESLSSL